MSKDMDLIVQWDKVKLQPFDNRPNFLRSSHGYIYGTCSRLYNFAFNLGQIGHTSKVIELMKLGKERHKQIQTELSKVLPNGYSEQFRVKAEKIVTHNKEHFIICTTHLDYLVKSDNEYYAIEIKPYYTYGTYIQVLLQKLIKPEYNYMYFLYKGNKMLLPAKTNYEMSKVYLSRILTARKYLTPIPEKLHRKHIICTNCYWYDDCYSYYYKHNTVSWDMFTAVSKVMLKRLSIAKP